MWRTTENKKTRISGQTWIAERFIQYSSFCFGQLSCLGFVLPAQFSRFWLEIGTDARIGLHWEKARGGRGQACT